MHENGSLLLIKSVLKQPKLEFSCSFITSQVHSVTDTTVPPNLACSSQAWKGRGEGAWGIPLKNGENGQIHCSAEVI